MKDQKMELTQQEAPEQDEYIEEIDAEEADANGGCPRCSPPSGP